MQMITAMTATMTLATLLNGSGRPMNPINHQSIQQINPATIIQMTALPSDCPEIAASISIIKSLSLSAELGSVRLKDRRLLFLWPLQK